MNRQDKKQARANGFRFVLIRKSTRTGWLRNYAEAGLSIDQLVRMGMAAYQEGAEPPFDPERPR